MMLRLSAILVFLLVCGCSRDAEPVGSSELTATNELKIGTAPPGGVFHVVGVAMADVLDRALRPATAAAVTPLETKGTLENVEMLNAGKLDFALANAATVFFAMDQGYPMRVVMTLAPNVALFVTRNDSGIQTIQDLAGKRVIIGPAGAGFEFFLIPILVAHDLPYEEIRPMYASQLRAVEMLLAGQADAAFLGGAIPTESIQQASEQMDIYFVPFEDLPTKVLKTEFGFFTDATIPAGTYHGQTDAFEGLNVGSMQLITSAAMDPELVYQVTKAIYQNRDEIAKRHPAGKAINPSTVVQDTGTLFHPGAVRYYKEIGIWKGE